MRSSCFIIRAGQHAIYSHFDCWVPIPTAPLSIPCASIPTSSFPFFSPNALRFSQSELLVRTLASCFSSDDFLPPVTISIRDRCDDLYTLVRLSIDDYCVSCLFPSRRSYYISLHFLVQFCSIFYCLSLPPALFPKFPAMDRSATATVRRSYPMLARMPDRSVVPVLQCACSWAAFNRTSGTDRNPGRRFYTCSVWFSSFIVSVIALANI